MAREQGTPQVNGHKKPGCKGQWISIGTMVDPLLQKCLECKGIRRSREEEAAPEPLLEEAAEPEPELPIEARPLSRRTLYLLLGAALVLACWAYSQAQ